MERDLHAKQRTQRQAVAVGSKQTNSSTKSSGTNLAVVDLLHYDGVLQGVRTIQVWRPRRILPALSGNLRVGQSHAQASDDITLSSLRAWTGAHHCSVANPAVQRGSPRLPTYQQLASSQRRTFVKSQTTHPAESTLAARSAGETFISTHAAVASWMNHAHYSVPSTANSCLPAAPSMSWKGCRRFSETPHERSDRWQRLPEGVWRDVLTLLPPPAACNFALVCRRWRAMRAGNQAVLRPTKPKLHLLHSSLPALRSLDLSGCRAVRNRSLAALAGCGGRSALQLQRLVIGHPHRAAAVIPSITNQALMHVARLTTLTELRLASCNKVTAAGIVAAVGRLTRLAVLALECCAHVNDAVAAELIICLPHLDSLSTAGCHKVRGPELLEAAEHVAGNVYSIRRALRALHLGPGAPRVHGTPHELSGGPALAELTQLTSLTLQGPADTDLIQAVASLQGLRRLQLEDLQSDPAIVVAVVVSLPHLAALRAAVTELADAHLDAICEARPGLIVLDIRDTAVQRLQSLSRLAGLASLSLSVSPAMLPGLSILAPLSRLVHLRATNCGFEPVLLRAATKLPLLAHLHIGEVGEVAANDPNIKAATAPAITLLHSCYALATLDVSCLHISHTQVVKLLSQMQQLRSISVRGCPGITAVHLVDLSSQFPSVHVHTYFATQ